MKRQMNDRFKEPADHLAGTGRVTLVNTLLTAIAIAVLSGCNDSTFKLNGTVEPDSGLTEVYISVGIEGEADRFMPEEKLPVINGKFTYSSEIKEIVKASIRKAPYSNTSVFLVPGETLELTYSGNGYSYGGSRIYREYHDADNAITPSRNAMDDYVDKFYSEQARIRPDEVLARKDTMTRLSEEYFETMTRYIRDNCDKEGVILYFSQTYPIDSLACFMGERVRQGRVGKYVDRLVRRTNEQRAQIRQNRIDEQKKLDAGIGTKAKDFTLDDLGGKPLSLSSLKGKYVILDFWGSWCGWCIRGFPKMKEYYEKYNDKMEILGIDCNDSPEAWHAAVEKYGLPWLHVYNPDSSSLTEDYGITGFPTKIIIGPEGDIVKVIAGEDPAFYSFLDELL